MPGLGKCWEDQRSTLPILSSPFSNCPLNASPGDGCQNHEMRQQQLLILSGSKEGHPLQKELQTSQIYDVSITFNHANHLYPLAFLEMHTQVCSWQWGSIGKREKQDNRSSVTLPVTTCLHLCWVVLFSVRKPRFKNEWKLLRVVIGMAQVASGSYLLPYLILRDGICTNGPLILYTKQVSLCWCSTESCRKNDKLFA